LDIEKEEKIKIGFVVYDPKQSKVLRDVCVRKINSSADIGCEFLSYDHHGTLEKYL